MVAKKTLEATTATLTDGSIPIEHRRAILQHLIAEESPQGLKVVEHLLETAAKGNGKSLHAKKAKELAQLIEELRSGPLRLATFQVAVPGQGSSSPRAWVVLESGESACPLLLDSELASSLRRGDSILLDAQARAVLFRGPDEPPVGEEAEFQRILDADRVEAAVREHEPFVFHVAAGLKEKIEAGQVRSGGKLLVCTRRAFAFDAVPMPEGLTHYRHLCREAVPEVVVDRDVGSPPKFIEELLDHLHTELERPDLGRRYRVRRARTKLLTGVSGSGKSLSIRAFWRLMYELMSSRTGVAIEELPPRVFRLRMPQVLSKWLGDSDKNLDRFFDEIEQVAAEPFVMPNGVEQDLPVLVVCEEIDGLARARGGGDEVYDRIQTTALERLDVNCQKLGDRMIIFIFTTNVAHLVDPAFLRRAGGTTEQFGRLERRAFSSVLEKHVRGLPLSGRHGSDQRAGEREVLREVTNWLYSPNGDDPGQVELTYVGSSSPLVKHRRHFVTAALVDRAIQQAAGVACRAERLGTDDPGVDAELLKSAFDEQVRSVVEQLTAANVGDYLTLPDGVRVGTLRRLEAPPVRAFELERR